MDNTERELWELKSTRCSKCSCAGASTKKIYSEPAPDNATSSEVKYVSDDRSDGESITPNATADDVDWCFTVTFGRLTGPSDSLR